MKKYQILLILSILLMIFSTSCNDMFGKYTNVYDPENWVTVTDLTVSGVTVPVSGGTPVKTVKETDQYTGSISWSPMVSSTFIKDTVYTATISLLPKFGYTLKGVANNSFTVAGATSVKNSVNSGFITVEFPATPTKITLLAIPGVTVPVSDATPITYVSTEEYTGSISWSPIVSSKFLNNTVYTATITLTPKTGYSVIGVAENSFTVDGANSVTNSIDSGIVTAVFPITTTDKKVSSKIYGVTPPVSRHTPATSYDYSSEYSETITWSPAVSSTFIEGIIYTATITITPKTGYTVTGLKENYFTVAGSTSVTNNANSGVVTAVFPVTGSDINISTNTTWSGTVNLTGDVIVNSGSSLTILPGTQIIARPGYDIDIYVNGTLSAVGNSSSPIVFKSNASSPSTDDWDGFGCSGGTMTLQYCVIEDADDGIFNFSSSGTTLSVQNTCFTNCYSGIIAFAQPTLAKYITFDNCTYGFWGACLSSNVSYCIFKNNSFYGVWAPYSDCTLNVSFSNFIGNGTDAHILGGLSSSNPKSNIILNLSNCYPVSLTTTISGTYNTNCSINITNGTSTQISTAGCGFDYSAYTRSSSFSHKVLSRSASTYDVEVLREQEEQNRIRNEEAIYITVN